MKDKKKSQQFGYGKFLLALSAALVAVLCVGAFVFWKYLDAYEVSREKHAIQALHDNIDYDYWVGSAEAELETRLSEFESSAADALSPHLSKILDVNYTLRKNNNESTDSAPVYTLRAGPRDMGVVRLVAVEDAGFGFKIWAVDSMEFVESFVDDFCRDISITASQNALVEINGVPVSSDYRVDCETPYAASYLVQGIYGDAAIRVTEFNGSIAEPFFAENGEYLYPITIPFSRNISAVVPEDAQLFVDGERVSPEMITQTRIVPEIFRVYDAGDDAGGGTGTGGDAGGGTGDDAQGVPMFLCRYDFELDGFYEEPVVTAVDAYGRELVADGYFEGAALFALPLSAELKDEHSAMVEDFIRAYIDFGANSGDNEMINFAKVSKYIRPDSDFYRRLQSSIGTMVHNRGVSISYNSLDIDTFRGYGDDIFTCRVSYSVNHKDYYEEREVVGNYEILFAFSDGKWLVDGIVEINDRIT